MSEKPEALRLAHELDAYHNAPHHKLAAQMLRLQHAGNMGLLADNERLTADNEALRRDAERWKEALHRISLASQNSMSGKDECGRIARTALQGDKT